MSLSLNDFTAARGEQFILIRNTAGEATGVTNRTTFQGREVLFIAGENRGYDSAEDRENVETKQAFIQALQTSLGESATALALSDLMPSWATSPTPLDERQVKSIVEATERFKNEIVERNKADMERFINARAPEAGAQLPPATLHCGLADVLQWMRSRPTGALVPECDIGNPEFLALFRAEMEAHPAFGRALLVPLDSPDDYQVFLEPAYVAVEKFTEARLNAALEAAMADIEKFSHSGFGQRPVGVGQAHEAGPVLRTLEVDFRF